MIETNTDKALEIAERILLLDSQIEGLKEWILSQPGAPTRKQLDRDLFPLDSEARLDPTFRERYGELKSAMEGQDDSVTLLHLLYQHLLHIQTMSRDRP